MNTASFWNGIIADHAASQIRATKTVTPADDYRGWSISWDYGTFTGIGPDYDCSWEGEEDGWRDNGQLLTCRTREGLIEEIDAWFEDQAARLSPTNQGQGDVR